MSALLEFRKPQADIIKYPPSAIWRQRRKRRIRLPKGRKQLTKNELEKYFGKGWSFGSDSSMMSYEETRARADAVQAQRVRGERLAILDREVDNNRDRLRLEGEIANIDERVRMRQLEIEDQRFRHQLAQGREAEERQVALLEQGEERRREEAERFERVRAEENARHDRLYDEQRRFFQQQLEVGERRAGEMTARLTDALAQNRAQRGGDVPIRFFVASDSDEEGGGEGGGFEDITTPRSALKKTVSTVRDLLARQPAPEPAPEPATEEEQLPLLSPTQSGALEERRRSFIEEGKSGGGSVRATETPKAVLERHRQSPQFRGRRQRRGAVGAVPLRSGIEQEITDEGISPPVEATRLLVKAQEEGGGAGGRSPRRLTKKEAGYGGDEAIRELELGSPAVPPADIAKLERQLEKKPETAVQQLGKVAGGVVSALTGMGGGGVAKVPVRSGEQSGGLGVAIQGEEGTVAEGVFGAQQGEETFLLPEVPEPATEEEQQPLLPQGKRVGVEGRLVEEEEEEELEDAFSIARRTGVSAEELQEEQKRQRIERDRKRADRYNPIEWKEIKKGMKDASKFSGMTPQGQLYLEVREPFDTSNYIGQNVGLYKVKKGPSREGTGSGNTQRFNFTFKHRGFKDENQIWAYKKSRITGKNVFEEALADGKIRFVVRPKGASSGDEV